MPVTPSIEDYLTRARQRDPNYRLPAGYVWDGTKVVRGGRDFNIPLGGVPGAGSPGQINVPLGGGEGRPGGGTTPTIGSPGYVDGFPGGVLPGTPTGMPTAPAAPGTGGAATSRPGNGITGSILDWLSNPANWGSLLGTLGDVGSVVGNQAAGAAAGRVTEADLLSRRDLASNQQYAVQQNAEMGLGSLDLQRKNFSEDARGNRGKQATVADMLANFQPSKVSVPGVPSATVSGGLSVTPGARNSLNELSRQALAKLMEGDTFEGGNVLTPPTLSEIPKPSGLETAAGTAGSITQILGALAPLFGGRRPTTPPVTR